ncbi:MAG: hypothetical protein GDA41_11430 [Rhodospirillales bacterium]|nr:hypothetical protein [Rhodospirillales bacterium]
MREELHDGGKKSSGGAPGTKRRGTKNGAEAIGMARSKVLQGFEDAA